ncbi:MAG: 3-isopropylmalate dehydratase [Promethearchaeota archaeon]
MSKGVNSVKGRAWRFGANISTDDIISGVHLTELKIEKLATFVFESLRPDFAQKVQPDDIIVAGENFGMGSSREGAPAILRYLRIGAIVAASFARIFFRNAFNLGIPAIEFPELAKNPDLVHEGDVIEIQFKDGILINKNTKKQYRITKIPPFLLEYLNAGGAIPLLKQKLKTG